MKPMSEGSQRACTPLHASDAKHRLCTRVSHTCGGSRRTAPLTPSARTVSGLSPTGPPPLQMPGLRLGSFASDQPATGRGCLSPLLRVDRLPEWLTELRKLSLLPVCLKGYKPGAEDGGEAQGKVWGRGAELRRPPHPVHCPPSTPVHSPPTPKLSRPCILEGF